MQLTQNDTTSIPLPFFSWPIHDLEIMLLKERIYLDNKATLHGQDSVKATPHHTHTQLLVPSSRTAREGLSGIGTRLDRQTAVVSGSRQLLH